MTRRNLDRPAGDVSFALYFMLTITCKGRAQVIDKAAATFLHAFWREKCEELEIKLLALGILTDHVHFLLSLRPTHFIPDVVHGLKGSASHAVNHDEQLAATLYWSKGYDIRTVSERNLDSARGYVFGQHSRHPDRVPR